MKIRQSERDRAKLCPTSRSGTSPYRQSAEFFYFQPLYLHFRLTSSYQLREARACLVAQFLPSGTSLPALGRGLCCVNPLQAGGSGLGIREHNLAGHPAHPLPKTSLSCILVLRPCPPWYMLSKPILKGLYSSPGNLIQVFIFLCL